MRWEVRTKWGKLRITWKQFATSYWIDYMKCKRNMPSFRTFFYPFRVMIHQSHHILNQWIMQVTSTLMIDLSWCSVNCNNTLFSISFSLWMYNWLRLHHCQNTFITFTFKCLTTTTTITTILLLQLLLLLLLLQLLLLLPIIQPLICLSIYLSVSIFLFPDGSPVITLRGILKGLFNIPVSEDLILKNK